MKIIFEVSDFKRDDAWRLSGAVVRPIQYRVDDDRQYYGEPWLIGSVTPPHDVEDRTKRWVLVSLLDGLVNGPYTPEQLVEILNKGNGYMREATPLIIGKEIQNGR